MAIEAGDAPTFEPSWDHRVTDRLARIRDAGRWRSLRPLDGHGPVFQLDGREVVSFASNDYLGLTGHPAVIEAAIEETRRSGTGSGSSRLIVGDRTVHHRLEDAIAAWKRTDRALLFPTGFAANLGVLSALADAPEVLVVSDALNHASIIDGARLGRGKVAVARHLDVDHVSDLLERHRGPAIVVTDTVFSMDGDVAPVEDLAKVCGAAGALLVLDEAHAVLGPEVPADLPCTVIRAGTLSKTLGSLGGYVAGPAPVVDLLINVARSHIFTTGATPASAAAALAALEILTSPEGAALLTRLRANVDVVAPDHPSPIVPVVLGTEGRAVAASGALLAARLLVPAIRPPTVPAGTARLRIALSAAHTGEHTRRLRDALDNLL